MGDVHEVVLPGCPFLRKLSPDIIFPSRPLFIIIITIIIIDHTIIIIIRMIIITQGQSRAKWTAQLASVRLDSRAPWEQVQQSSSHRVIM